MASEPSEDPLVSHDAASSQGDVALTDMRGSSALAKESVDGSVAVGSNESLCHKIRNPSMAVKTIIGVVLGVISGIAFRETDMKTDTPFFQHLFEYPGELWISALKMVVIPMIACVMVLSVVKLGDITKIKRIGGKALTYYLSTTFIACLEGLIWVNIIQPGKSSSSKQGSFDAEKAAGAICQIVHDNSTGVEQTHSCYAQIAEKNTDDTFFDLGRSMLHGNLVESFLDFNILGIIVFCLMFGYYLTKEEHSDIVLKFLEACNGAFMGMISMIIWWTPLGVCSLIFGVISGVDDLWQLFADLGLYTVTASVGILIHLTCMYPLIYWVVTRKNPYRILRGLSAPCATAFATSSSAATLPVTMNTCEEMGVSTEITRFILPLGATCNMDGTAIYFPIAVIFLANWSGIAVNFGEQLIIAIVSAFVSIGAAPIPNAGVVYLLLIMAAVNMPTSGSITFVLAIDWFLDRLQTMCNVSGDSFGANILQYYMEKDIIEERESAKAQGLADQTEQDPEDQTAAGEQKKALP